MPRSVLQDNARDHLHNRAFSQHGELPLFPEDLLLQGFQVGVRPLEHGFHVFSKLTEVGDPKRGGLFRGHSGALPLCRHTGFLRPSLGIPERRLLLEERVEDDVLGPNVVPDDEGDGAAPVHGPEVKLLIAQVGHGLEQILVKIPGC